MKEKYLNKENMLSDLQEERSRLIFLTGKTSTGKTTLSNEIISLGYGLVVLDIIVNESVIKRFKTGEHEAFGVYKGNAPQEWINSFIESVRENISLNLSRGPVLVEGALVNIEILNKIFSGELKDFLFIFLLPTDAKRHSERVTNRFMSGIEAGETALPKEFFERVDKEQIDTYMKTKEVNNTLKERISQFAICAQEESIKRLDHFKESGKTITVLEV